MNAITKFLIPFDFTPLAYNALSYATNYCKVHIACEVILLYCSSKENHEQKSEQMILAVQEMQATARAHITGEVISGELTTSIVNAVDRHKPHLLVMGTKGADKVSAKALTNTAEVTLNARCAVIVVPESYTKFRLKNVTLAITAGEIDEPTVLSTLLVIARDLNAKVHVLSILNDKTPTDFVDTKTERILEYYFEKYYVSSSYISSTNIAQSIVAYDEAQSIDLLAIIPRNHTKHSPKSQGRLTSFLAINSIIPLLTMNQAEQETKEQTI